MDASLLNHSPLTDFKEKSVLWDSRLEVNENVVSIVFTKISPFLPITGLLNRKDLSTSD